MKSLKDLQPKGRNYEVRVAKNLIARVNTDGTIACYFAFSIANSRSKMRVGVYPTLTEVEIKKAYQAAAGDVARGIDPLHRRREEMLKRREEQMERKMLVSVEQAADNFLRDIQYQVARKTWLGYRSCLRRHLGESSLWRHPVKDVTYFDLVEIVREIHENGTPAAAGNFKRAMSRFFNWCVTAGYVTYSVALKLSPKSSDDKSHDEKPERSRVYTDDEIRRLWEALEGPYADTARMVLLTGCRRPEICGMHTDEIDGDGWWNIPASRVKTRVPHRVFITPMVRDIIAGKEGLIFPQLGQFANRPVRPERVTRVFKAAREKAGLMDVRMYDGRRTLRTRVEKKFTFSPVGKLLLNHGTDQITRVYNQYQYDDEKREALLWWDAELRRILYGSKVVDFADASARYGGYAKKRAL